MLYLQIWPYRRYVCSRLSALDFHEILQGGFYNMSGHCDFHKNRLIDRRTVLKGTNEFLRLLSIVWQCTRAAWHFLLFQRKPSSTYRWLTNERECTSQIRFIWWRYRAPAVDCFIAPFSFFTSDQLTLQEWYCKLVYYLKHRCGSPSRSVVYKRMWV